MKKFQDISGDIGDRVYNSDCSNPMYSFSRPAYILWQGFYDGLRQRGLSHEQAMDEMQSKGTRWMLDGEASKKIERLGQKMAANYTLVCS
jgi:hypothetical protein